MKSNEYWALYRYGRLECVEKKQDNCRLVAQILRNEDWKYIKNEFIFKKIRITVIL